MVMNEAKPETAEPGVAPAVEAKDDVEDKKEPPVAQEAWQEVSDDETSSFSSAGSSVGGVE